MSRKQARGPVLPRSVLDHIDGAHPGQGRPKRTDGLSRKDARKQDRLGRKQRRAEHFQVPKTDDDAPVAKRRKTVHFAEEKRHPPKPAPPKQTALEKLALQATRKVARVPRTREETEEDAYIAYLESKLGYANGAKRRTGDEEDGLGDLFDFANSLEDSLWDVPGHADGRDEEYSEVDDASDNHGSEDDSDEWTGFDAEGDENQASDVQDSESRPSIHQQNDDKTPTGPYIPPGLRKEGEGEDTVKLTRQLKGLINRMSEQNMATVLDAVEEVYRKHRRHDVTSTLTTLMIDGISSHSILLDSFVVLHAAFVSSLHRLVGVEFAASVVQNVVSAYERHLQDYENDVPDVTTQSEQRGKECSNLLVLLSELYNFQVISCILLYDIIKDLLSETLTEFRVELLLKILRSSGQQLRQDDPLVLKDIITLAQSRIADQGDDTSSRTKFMIETLTNLKNNKVKKSATQHQGGDAVERMKKFLSGLGKKRHVQAHEALRISLSDLRAAETKGKWWLVGAAWGGDPLVDQQRDASTVRHEADAQDLNDTVLVKLARKQGMNTDIRRSIFVVLMSSDDYVDACERLAQLNLTEVQQREIVRVILHCCGNEKSYNPYYALVCQQLCQRSHAYRITLQFCLWDFLRDLGETSVGGAEVIKTLGDDDGRFELKSISPSRIKNVAKAYAWWIAKDCCPISILKPVDFTILKPPSRTFLRELFVHVFVASQTSSPMLTDGAEQTSRNRGAVEDIFVKATRMENLGLGLIFFLSNAFKGEDGLLKWASGVAKETLQTRMDEIPRL